MYRSPILNAKDLGLSDAAVKMLQQAFDSIHADLRSIESTSRSTSSAVRATAQQVLNVNNITSEGTALLARIPGVSLASVANTEVFSATDGDYIILDIVVRITSAAAAVTDGPVVSVGSVAGTGNIFGAMKLRGTLNSPVAVALGDRGTRPTITLGSKLYFNVTTVSVATALTATVDVIGYKI